MRNLTILLLLAGLALAEVSITATELKRKDKRAVSVRAAFRVKGHAHRRLDVYFQVRGPDAKALVGADKKPLLQKWGDVLVPDSGHAVSWSQCRLDIPLAWLEAATNLPKGVSLLKIVCDIWDPLQKKYLAAGHAVAASLWVKVGADGKIATYECFSVQPTPLVPTKWGDKKEAVVCRFGIQHLKLKPKTGAYRSVGEKHNVYDILHLHRNVGTSHEQGELEDLSRGHFFVPITTKEQARELALLAHSGALVIPTREAYDTCQKYLRDKGWQSAIKSKTPPPTYGVRVHKIPGAGWRVYVLLQELHGYNRKRQGVVWWIDYHVDPQGRIGETRREIINTGADVFTGGIAQAKQWPRVPTWFKTTDKVVNIPSRGNESPCLKVAKWPEGMRD